MSEKEWRETVVSHVNKLNATLAENNDMTSEVKAEVTAMKDEMRPMVDAYSKVTKGFEVLGWIGSAAEWLIKKWMWVVITIVAAKIILSGGPWSEVVKLFKEIP